MLPHNAAAVCSVWCECLLSNLEWTLRGPWAHLSIAISEVTVCDMEFHLTRQPQILLRSIFLLLPCSVGDLVSRSSLNKKHCTVAVWMTSEYCDQMQRSLDTGHLLLYVSSRPVLVFAMLLTCSPDNAHLAGQGGSGVLSRGHGIQHAVKVLDYHTLSEDWMWPLWQWQILFVT